jgi:hypothetical protein
MMCTTTADLVRVELSIKKSGELLRKGMTQFELSRAPQDAWLLQHDEEIDVVPPSHSKVSGMIPISDAKRNSGEVLQWTTENRED